jgi:phosphatidylserine/phosphatidylglycerophosphate/cardiolipin synthase-like enzyme
VDNFLGGLDKKQKKWYNITMVIVADVNYISAIQDMVAKANKKIVLGQYEFNIGNRTVTNAGYKIANWLIEAKNRGVDVIVYLNRARRSSAIYWNNQETKQYLEQNGIVVYTTDIVTVLHAKLVVVDSIEILLGSHNITHKSIYGTKEISIRFVNAQYAKYIEQYLQSLPVVR